MSWTHQHIHLHCHVGFSSTRMNTAFKALRQPDHAVKFRLLDPAGSGARTKQIFGNSVATQLYKLKSITYHQSKVCSIVCYLLMLRCHMSKRVTDLVIFSKQFAQSGNGIKINSCTIQPVLYAALY